MEGDLPYSMSALEMNNKNNLIDRYKCHAEYIQASRQTQPTFRIPVATPGTRLVRQRNARNNNNLRPLTQSNGNAIQDHHSITLDFCLLNAQSLNNKAGEFTALVCEYKPDLVALIETWFYPMESASRTLCTPASYKLLDYPRTSRTGGGTGVLFRDNLTVKKGLLLNCVHLSTLSGILSLKLTGFTLLSSTEHHTLTRI